MMRSKVVASIFAVVILLGLFIWSIANLPLLEGQGTGAQEASFYIFVIFAAIGLEASMFYVATWLLK